MGYMQEVRVPIVDAAGQVNATLVISVLPAKGQRAQPGLFDLRGELGHDQSTEPLQLVEGEEYLYEIEDMSDPTSRVDPEPYELFFPDSEAALRGRLRPGLYTGTLSVSFRQGGLELGRALFEVRSRKLDYLSQYRWMLRDVADQLAELVMERFAPTEQSFTLDETRDAVSLYQRFAFLKDLISGDRFETAVHQVLVRPHRAWVVEDEFRRAGQGFPATSAVLRQMSKPGPRLSWPGGRPTGAPATLPIGMPVQRTEETLDTPENRFVKFALTHWRDFVAEVRRVLESEKPAAPVRRGLREVEAVAERLEEVLAAHLFDEVDRMTQFPAGSQVLQKREGYRDLLQAYVQFETAALLTWDGGADVYGAGQRDVATLYEYWVFFKLSEIVARLCQGTLDYSSLLEFKSDGLGVTLKRGRTNGFSGTISRLGRKLEVHLYFNHTFGKGTGALGSWTRPMRPDCSLRIRPVSSGGYQSEEVWLHFDAKYRVEDVVGLFGPNPITEDDEAKVLDSEQAPEAKQNPKRADLLKMHAYRDAIRRSAGAYVIYPGTETEAPRKYHEVLPGLGAFALQPSETGEAAGAGALHEFIDEVFTHVASQVTQHERTRFWEREANLQRYRVEAPHPPVTMLNRPPADTLVLLGFVRTERQLQWIHHQRRYNLRADDRNGSVGIASRELAVEFVLLYSYTGSTFMKEPELWRVDGPPELFTRDRMARTGYGSPGPAYFCLPIAQPHVDTWAPTLSGADVVQIREESQPDAEFGAPVVVTWLDLLRRGEG